MEAHIYSGHCPGFDGLQCKCGNNGGGDCDYCSEIEYFYNNPDEVKGLTFEQFQADVHTPPPGSFLRVLKGAELYSEKEWADLVKKNNEKNYAVGITRPPSIAPMRRDLEKIHLEAQAEQASFYKDWALGRSGSDPFDDQATAGKVAAALLLGVLLVAWVALKGCVDMPQPAPQASLSHVMQAEAGECGP